MRYIETAPKIHNAIEKQIQFLREQLASIVKGARGNPIPFGDDERRYTPNFTLSIAKPKVMARPVVPPGARWANVTMTLTEPTQVQIEFTTIGAGAAIAATAFDVADFPFGDEPIARRGIEMTLTELLGGGGSIARPVDDPIMGDLNRAIVDFVRVDDGDAITFLPAGGVWSANFRAGASR